MILKYNAEKLEEILNDFYRATGINILLYSNDFTALYIGKRPMVKYCQAIQSSNQQQLVCEVSDVQLLRKCQSSKKMEMHYCHAGLLDFCVPILYDNIILGYIMCGQIKKEDDFSKVKNKIASMGIDIKMMEDFYTEIPCYDDEKIRSITNIAVMLGKYILLENVMKPYFIPEIENALEYIQTNLNENISIKDICSYAHVSTSVLYKYFYNYFGCTVNEYINAQRIEESLELLKKTDLSIEVIASRTGFSSASYFTNIFKKKMGISPLKYKKNLVCR